MARLLTSFSEIAPYEGHYAFAAGSEMSGGVDGVYVYNCTAPIYVKAGVFIKSSRRRGGTVKNVFIKDLEINKTVMGINLIPNYDGDKEAPHPPTFSDIHFKNIHIEKSKFPLRIYGWHDAITKDLSFTDVTFDEVETGLDYNFVENIQLTNVKLGSEEISDQNLSKAEENGAPPEQN